MPEIYGVDPQKPFTALDVRDAVVVCFEQAHKEVEKKAFERINPDSRDKEGEEKIAVMNTRKLVEMAFEKTGGDFMNPNKASIIKAINWLAEFSKDFRPPEEIKKHYNEIRSLVDRLP